MIQGKQFRRMAVLLLTVIVVLAIASAAVASQIGSTKEAYPSPQGVNTFYPGQTIYYVMTVSNPASNPFTNTLTRIWDTLPDGTEIEFLGPGDTLVQPPGATTTFTAEYVVKETDAGKTITNKFEAEGYDNATPEPDIVYARVTRNSRILPFAELGDLLWNDVNRNGIQEVGEPGIEGVKVYLHDCDTNAELTSTVTAADGTYYFKKLKAGDYYVRFDKPAGDWAFTLKDQGADDAKDSDVDAAGKTGCYTLEPGNKNYTADAGVYQLKEKLVVSKTAVTSYMRTHKWLIDKWVETDNGKSEEFEDGTFPKIWLYVDGSGDESAHWHVKVDYDGYRDSHFSVSGTITIENTGDLDAVITDVKDVMGTVPADVTLPVTLPYTLPKGETLVATYAEDVGSKIEGPNVATVETRRDTYTGSAAITWGDPTKEFYKKVTIKDVSDLFGEQTLGTVTAPNGDTFRYSKSFAWIDFSSPGPHFFHNRATIVETEQSDTATLVVNWVPPASIGNFVWNDADRDGIQDAGEQGIAGVKVNLFKCDDTPMGSTITDANGYYRFDNLMAGKYYVTFVLPTGYTFTMQNVGTDDAIDSDADVTTGKTECVQLDAGEYDDTVDAGMYRQITYCWKDETAWAYGGRVYAKPLWNYVNNTNWGWTNGPLPQGTYTWPLYADAGQNDLSKGSVVGTVTVMYSSGTVHVMYQTKPGYYIGEAHLWVGNEPLPKVRGKYTSAPGQFPYGGKLGFDPMDPSSWKTTWTWHRSGFTGNIWVAAHGVIWWQVECPPMYQ